MFKKLKIVGVVFLVFLLSCCTTKVQEHAGGAGSETNYGINARLTDVHGNSLKSVAYQVRPSWYVRASDDESAVEKLPIVKYANGVSDEKGNIDLPLLAPGNYVLNAQAKDLGVLHSLKITEKDTALVLGDLKLDSLAEVNGEVPVIDGTPMRVRVYGTEKLVWTDSTGKFTIDSLPPGNRIIIVDQPEKAVIVGELSLDSHATSLSINADVWGSAAFNASTWNYRVEVSENYFLRDSIWEKDKRWADLDPPLLLYIDHRLVDFNEASSDGADIRITNTSNQLLSSQIRYWDPIARRALVWVKTHPQDLVLYYGKSGAPMLDSTQDLWGAWPDSALIAFTRIDLDDFEDGDITNNLPGTLAQHNWYRGLDSLSRYVEPAADASSKLLIADDSLGRNKVLRIRYTSEMNSWVLMGTILSQTPKDFRMLDSIVLWARGDGNMFVALENSTIQPEIKAWKTFALHKDWQRYMVRPQDFEEPGIGGNRGWEAVHKEITTLSVFGQGGTELWIDDVQIFGISPFELLINF